MYMLDMMYMFLYNNLMSTVVTATSARANFFNLLNRVLYGNEDVYIKKAGVDVMIKLEVVTNSRTTLSSLAGSLSKKDSATMLDSIINARKIKPRNIVLLD